MKIKFEFDTESENFCPQELATFQYAGALRRTVSDILELARQWEKYGDRDAIPVDEIRDSIIELCEGLDFNELGL